MNTFEMVLCASFMVVVAGSWWYAVTRPAFSEFMTAWAERHGEAVRNKIADEWVAGYEAGQEYERMRGSKPRG